MGVSCQRAISNSCVMLIFLNLNVRGHTIYYFKISSTLNSADPNCVLSHTQEARELHLCLVPCTWGLSYVLSHTQEARGLQLYFVSYTGGQGTPAVFCLIHRTPGDSSCVLSHTQEARELQLCLVSYTGGQGSSAVSCLIQKRPGDSPGIPSVSCLIHRRPKDSSCIYDLSHMKEARGLQLHLSRSCLILRRQRTPIFVLSHTQEARGLHLYFVSLRVCLVSYKGGQRTPAVFCLIHKRTIDSNCALSYTGGQGISAVF